MPILLRGPTGAAGGGGGGTVNDYGYPSYATLMARPNRVDMATVHGATSTTQITYGTGVGDFVTFNAEGWSGRPNGGKNGQNWGAGWPYVVGDMVEPPTANGFAYKVTAAGTSGATQPAWPGTVGSSVTANGVTYKNVGATTATQPNIFNMGNTGPITSVRQIAFLGSSPSTSAANVGRVDGLDVNNAQELFPLDCYRWSWKDRKGEGQADDPSGTWTGPNLDEHALRLRGLVEAGGAWSIIVDGMLFRDLNDAVGIQSESGAKTIFRNCVFLNVGDDSNESDFNNNSAEYYDCLFLNIYTIHSTTGTRNASAEQVLLKNCVVVFNHLPRQTGVSGISCPSLGMRDLTGTDGRYWAHGVIYKQPDANCPRLRIEDTSFFFPGYPASCRSGMSLSGPGFATASNSTLRFGRGKATTAGNGQAVPQTITAMENLDTATVYLPPEVMVTNDSTASYENARDAAVQSFIDGTPGRNPHPQFAGLLT